MNSACPWLHVWDANDCVNAFPSCVGTSCNSPASCQCMHECDEQLYLGFERTYKCSLPNGTWINYDFQLQQGGKYQYGEHISDALQATNDHATSCPNNCSGRGSCENGTCSCFQGYTHIDCSAGPEKYTKGFIYLYDLPRGANVWRQRIAEDRNSAVDLYEYILRSPYRTDDPEKARLFWLPISTMGSHPHGLAVKALEWVRRHHPWYNRSGGTDHVIVYPWDSGACWIANHPIVQPTIKISHFGLKERLQMMSCDCPLCGPGADVVIPDVMEKQYKRQRGRTRARTTFLFFAGTRSGTLRSRAIDALHEETNVRVITTGGADLAAEMMKSSYCLDAGGAGFSTRATLAIILGCVPVYVGDFLKPFESLLDYSEFSVVIPEHEMHRIVHHVRAANYTRLKEGVDKVWRHFWWTRLYGPIGGEDESEDAFAMMIKAFASCVQNGEQTGCSEA